jgi:autotransporter-associated beta strand protein
MKNTESKAPLSRGNWLRILTLLALGWSSATATQAATDRTWSGGGNATTNWNNADNWDGLPTSGDSLIFTGTPTYKTNANDFAAWQFLNITFNSGASAFTLLGNTFTLLGSIINNSSSLQSLNNAVALSGNSHIFTTSTGGGDLALGGIVSGTSSSGVIVKTGNGTLTFTGANTFIGTTYCQGGGVQYTGSSGNSGGGLVYIAYKGTGNTPTFTLNTSGEVKATGVQYEHGHSQAESLTLTAGTLTVGATGSTPLGAPAAGSYNLNLNGGTLKSSAPFSIAATYALTIKLNSGTSVIDMTGGNITSLSPFLLGTGAGNLTVQGGNTLALPASNTYSGTTLVTANSTMKLGASTLPGSVTVDAGSTFDMNDASQSMGGLAGAGTVVNSSSTAMRTLTITGSGGNIFSGAINPASADQANTAVTINLASGAQTFSGANTYSGGTTISNGILAVSNNAALGTGLVTMNGGSLTNAGGAWTVANVFNLTSAATVGVGGTDTLTLGGIITNSGALTKTGGGTLVMASSNTYSGATIVNAGILVGVTGGSCSNSAFTVALGATNGVNVATANGKWFCQGLTNNLGGAMDFNFIAPTVTGAAPIQVLGNLDVSGVNVIVRGAVSGVSGSQYELIKYQGILAGTVPGTAVSLPAGVTGTLSNNTANHSIDLVLTSTSTNYWAVGSGNWDAGTMNWKNTAASGVTNVFYIEGEAVVLDDTASGGAAP